MLNYPSNKKNTIKNDKVLFLIQLYWQNFKYQTMSRYGEYLEQEELI